MRKNENRYIAPVIKRYVIVLILFVLTSNVRGQDIHLIDSLNLTYLNAANDTARVNTLLDIAGLTYLSNPDTAIIVCNKALEIASATTMDSLTAECYGWLGYLLNQKGDIEQALTYFHQSLVMRQRIGDKKGEANSLNNIAYIYDGQGDFESALEFYQMSVELYGALSNEDDESLSLMGKRGVANALNNIGWMYDVKGDPSCTESKEACREASDIKALEYYRRSLKIREGMNDARGVAESLNNLGGIYHDQGDVEKALEYYSKSLEINKEGGMKSGAASGYYNVGSIFFNMGNTKEAKIYAAKGMALAQELGSPHLISNAAAFLQGIAKKEGDFKKALELYELFIQMRDSLKNEETQKATIRLQTKYEFEKAQLVDEQNKLEARRLQQEARSRRDNLQYSVILIAILTLFGGILALGFINVSERMAEGIIFFSFLILFEFVLVLADPYIDEWSGGAPGIKLLFNAGIAALIFPAHAFFEEKLKARIVK